MINDAQSVYFATADINLWMKIQSGDDYVLADFPVLLPYRWIWFRDNWETYKPKLINNLGSATYGITLKQQIDDLSKYISVQRYSSADINPFEGNTIFFRYYLVWEQVPVASATTSDIEQTLIDNEVNRINAFSKSNFVSAKNKVITLRDKLSDQNSGTDTTYNSVVYRSPVTAYVAPSISNLNNQLQYQYTIKTIDFILANQYTVNTAIVDPFALAKANANNPDIDIPLYKSGNLVRLNYGEDLRSLASRYLGDPDHWIDIAIANGLKSPYIDEVGVALPLIANASSNFINIAATDISGNINKDRVFINQPVILRSNAETFPDQRTILSIREIPVSGELVIELSGDSNLDKYKLVDYASVRVFAPNTINSSFFVLIPSLDEVTDPPSLDTPWFLKTSSDDEKRAKIDLALNQNMDLSLTPNNDLSLSYGLANAIQAIKLKLSIELGELQRHPGYGFVAIQGEKNIDIERTKSTITQSLTNQIEADSRFERLENLSVQYFGNGPEGPTGYYISMVVRLAGGKQTMPITFSINTT